MERRNFFKIAPFGLAGIAALATNPLNAEPTGSSVLKAKQLTIRGADGKDYHPLVVEAAATTHDEVPNASSEFLAMSSERMRVTSSGNLSVNTISEEQLYIQNNGYVGTSWAKPGKITFVSNGTENFRL